MNRTAPLLAFVAFALLATGCTAATPPEPSGAEHGDGHGHVEGAQEVAEAPLHLVALDEQGSVAMLDLLGDEWDELGEVPPAVATATDGRYVFSIADDGVTVIDSGVWTWDHIDHFHYYHAEPGILGTVEGDGVATIATTLMSTSGGTGMFFPGSGEAVLLDTHALSEGELVELFRVETEPHDGIVAPIDDGALVTQGDGSVQFLDATGEPVDGLSATCEAPGGHIVSRVGVVLGCADGVVLGTTEQGSLALESIPYPAGTATDDRAWVFANREGRPVVAALAGDAGIWMLDTRERTWQLIPVGVPLLQVVAVDDQLGHIVALDAEGRVRVYSAESGAELAATEPLLPDTLGTDSMAGVSLTVDQNRAYLNAPLEGVIYEIDYADAARIARTLEAPLMPLFLAETGR